MKKIKIVSIIALIFTATFFTSCTNDNEPIDPAIVIGGNNGGGGGGGGTPNGTFKVDIDGHTYTTNIVQARKVTSPLSPPNYLITGIFSEGGVASSVNLQIIDDGTNHYLSGSSDTVEINGLLSYFPNASVPDNMFVSDDFDEVYNITGEINFISHDVVNKKLSGNFHSTVFLVNPDTGVVLQTKILANGTFTNVVYN